MDEWWNSLALAELTPKQWELLCDGCAKCCLHKLEDDESGEVFYTKVRCRYLDEDVCHCSDYENRSALVPNCVRLDVSNVDEFEWLPSTCAYRLRAKNMPLETWHPLVSGNGSSVHDAGVSIRGRAVSDEYIHPDGYDEHIVNWVE